MLACLHDIFLRVQMWKLNNQTSSFTAFFFGDLPASGWVLAGWDECLLEEEEEEDDEEEEGLESSFRPSSSLSELNSSSCLCCSSNKDIFPLLVVAPAVTCPCPFCPNPTTRPVPWVLCPWPPLDQSMELRDFLEFWCGIAVDEDVVEGGGCIEAVEEEGVFPVFLSPPVSAPPPPPPPPPPAPPLRASLKSWDGSMAGLSVADVVGACCRLLFAVVPLGIPTKWLWLEWLVNRSFISSYEPSVFWTRLANASPLLVWEERRKTKKTRGKGDTEEY